MGNRKNETYMDKLLQNKDFKKKFEKEYQNLLIAEKIAQLRHSSNLTQATLAKRIHTTKSAISRYESGGYHRYSLSLLKRIAWACGADLEVRFNPHREQNKKKRRLVTAG